MANVADVGFLSCCEFGVARFGGVVVGAEGELDLFANIVFGPGGHFLYVLVEHVSCEDAIFFATLVDVARSAPAMPAVTACTVVPCFVAVFDYDFAEFVGPWGSVIVAIYVSGVGVGFVFGGVGFGIVWYCQKFDQRLAIRFRCIPRCRSGM